MKLSVLFLTVLLSAGSAAVKSDDLQSALQGLKDAQAQKDPAAVKKAALDMWALVKPMASAPAPADEAEKEAWKENVAYAREVEVQIDYAVVTTAFQSPAAAMVDLLSTLEQQNPKSKYLDEAYPHYIYALSQTGQAAKLPAMAAKAIVNFPENEDLLLVLADAARSRKQNDSALLYAKRLVTVLTKHPKPEGVAEADWDRKKTAELGRGYWIAGMVLSEKSQFYEADKNLRGALPLIKGVEPMMGPALYYLGVANFQLGKMTLNKAQVLEAVKFSEQAAAISGPFSQPAWHNAMVMKDEAIKMR
jgi:tetratricopeptide (TPR) repeat protein